MTEANQSSIIQIEAEINLADSSELDVIWVSGSAIAVAPRTDSSTQSVDYQSQEQSDNVREIPLGNSGYNESTDDSESDSDTTIDDYNPRDQEIQSLPDETEQLDENSVIIIQRENEREHTEQPEQSVQQPNVVTIQDTPTTGIENPIIRLENPDYEPESSTSLTSNTPRSTVKRSYKAMISDDDDDGKTCPVCFDMWTNEGDHRLCSLKCGHLFGKSCIRRWLTIERKKCCPQCNKKASPHDIRDLYATKLTAMDCSEKTKLEETVKQEKEKNRKLQAELFKCTVDLEQCKQELELLQAKYSFSKKSKSKKSLSKIERNSTNKMIKYHLEKTLEVVEGSCRVCAYDCLTNVLVISHQTRNQLFPGYGIRKIQKVGVDYFGNNFLYLHLKALRDLCFHPVTSNLILSVSFDRTAKLADLKTFTVLKTFKAEYPLWSCCWDMEETSIFYAGAGNGSVYVYDINYPDCHKSFLNSTDDTSAVVSLSYAPSKPSFRGGVICCRLNSITLYEKIGPNEYNPVQFHSLVGPFFSLSYDVDTQHLLASCRPSDEYSKVRHLYCELNSSGCNKIHTFFGGTRQTLLSRSCFTKMNGETIVAVFQENFNCIELWSTSTGTKIQSIPVNDQILDIISIKLQNKTLLGALSESLIRFYETTFS